MGCCGVQGEKEEVDEEKRMKKTNKEIEKQIQKDKQVRNTKIEFNEINTIQKTSSIQQNALLCL